VRGSSLGMGVIGGGGAGGAANLKGALAGGLGSAIGLATDVDFFRAVLAVHRGDPDAARVHIAAAREALGTELAALVTESYDRSYGGMIRVQQLTELEEVIEYGQLAGGGARVGDLHGAGAGGGGRVGLSRIVTEPPLFALVFAPTRSTPLWSLDQRAIQMRRRGCHGLDCHPTPSLCTGLCAKQVYTGMVS